MQTNRSNIGALVGGAIMIAFGLLSLTGQLFRSLNWDFFWPFIIIGFGALLFVVMFAGGKQSAALCHSRDSIVSGVGLVLLFQNITHHWESMSYFWTLIIACSLVLGIYIMGWYGGEETQKQSGVKVMKIGLDPVRHLWHVLRDDLLISSTTFSSRSCSLSLGHILCFHASGLFGGKKNDPTDALPPVS